MSSTAAATGARVRAATLRDLDTVVELRLALLRENGDHPIYGRLRADAEARASQLFSAQILASDQRIFLAERGGDIVGIARCVESLGSPLLHPSRYGYLSSVYVRPPFRRTGVLRALLQAAESWCRERGLDEIRLHNSSRSAEARDTWEHLGFELTEQVRVRRIE